jgi:hypothetical protein
MIRKCGPQCVEVIAGTNREKWNYVHNMYFPRPAVEIRLPADLARIADEAVLTTLFQTDEASWLSRYPTKPFEYWLQWKYERGTNAYGNLPEYKKDQSVGHCSAPCPYSTECTDERSEALTGSVPSGALTKVTHTVGGVTHYMFTEYSGMWGYRCEYDGCPYYLVNGQRYFYG